MGFRVKFVTEEQFFNGLKSLKDIGALSKEICIGTSLSNSVDVDDVISGKLKVYTDSPCDDDDVMEFSIGFETDEHVKKFKHLMGKNDVCVGLTTYYDCVKNNDVYGKIVLFDNMVEETLKLINSKQTKN
jgi:hypothetical protein